MTLAADRLLGRHYTPEALARRMVAAGLSAVATPPQPIRVLDPACGDGAFLVEVYEQLCRRWAASVGKATADAKSLTPDERLEIVRQSVFGVDIDPAAVTALRSIMIERIGAGGSLIATAKDVVNANIRHGDSLIGPDRLPIDSAHPRPKSTTPTRDHQGQFHPVIDWSCDFPLAVDGFDLVIGNPPYVRERDARALFDRIADSELGRRWRAARMDLWHYFAHRGLDLLRTGGILSFVVNSYWTASVGARRLIDRLERETHFEAIELLGNQPLFAGVSGRHLVFRTRKRPDERVDNNCRVVVHPDVRQKGTVRQNGKARDIAPVRPAEVTVHWVPHAELFQGGRIIVAPPDRLQSVRHSCRPLSDSFETRQGMAENPPAISRRLAERFPSSGPYLFGEGVFVLTPAELDRLALTPKERCLLRPYFGTDRLARYHVPAQADQVVLYLTHKTAPMLDAFPNIARHLERFRPILERRRETQQGKCAWWHLHWPRDESIFTRPRILSVQMGRRPAFVFAAFPTFVGFSVNVILQRAVDALSLAALTGILNSSLATDWFERHAKRRGVNLEINAGVLREFPLPATDAAIDRTVAQLVGRRQSPDMSSDVALEVEGEIESLVERWYGLTARANG